ncbi:MAG: DUF1566 domain-containing protein [Proteobacteria bacterium]|nr:DUF1566 domain-containing protein [Pseudomonadota bacterium]
MDVVLSISADDYIGVNAYYVSETDSTPNAAAAGWTDLIASTSYSRDISFVLSAGNGQKTVYIWFKDATGNISVQASDNIALAYDDTSAPTNPFVSINGGNGTADSLAVTLSISADDSIGVTGYYASETNSTPDATTDGWRDMTADADYSEEVVYYLSIDDALKTVYVWFKDAAGNVSDNASDSIELTGWIARNLPDTGQTSCYDGTGDSISCPSPGQSMAQDGSYSNNPRSYTDNDNGTITDNVTKLLWQEEDDDIQMTWADAEVYCADQHLGGYSGWRLPNIKEMLTIIDFGVSNPAMDQSIFPGVDEASYWSSTTSAGNPDNAWNIYTGGGSTNDYWGGKTNTFYVRCVRGGNGTDVWPLDFTDNGNGVVNHGSTGLMWQQEDESGKTWVGGLDYCKNLVISGFDDWRLPNVTELTTIVDFASSDPSIDRRFFPSTSSLYYWSSSTPAWDATLAFYVRFDIGGVDDYFGGKNNTYHVRCVRGGQ